MLSGSLMKKEKEAIERLQAFSAEEPYYLCYSGGKDSDTIRILAELANVNFEVHNNHTTVDAPETVYYTGSNKTVRQQRFYSLSRKDNVAVDR